MSRSLRSLADNNNNNDDDDNGDNDSSNSNNDNLIMITMMIIIVITIIIIIIALKCHVFMSPSYYCFENSSPSPPPTNNFDPSYRQPQPNVCLTTPTTPVMTTWWFLLTGGGGTSGNAPPDQWTFSVTNRHPVNWHSLLTPANKPHPQHNTSCHYQQESSHSLVPIVTM